MVVLLEEVGHVGCKPRADGQTRTNSPPMRSVIVCVCGCGEARPADSRSESVSHVDERSDGSNNDSDVLITTVALLTILKAFRCS